MRLLCRIYHKSSRFESTEFKSYSAFVPKYCGNNISFTLLSIYQKIAKDNALKTEINQI